MNSHWYDRSKRLVQSANAENHWCESCEQLAVRVALALEAAYDEGKTAAEDESSNLVPHGEEG